MPPCNKERNFSVEDSCFAYLEGALCLWYVLEKHLSISSLPCKGPGAALLPSSFGTWIIGTWGTAVV